MKEHRQNMQWDDIEAKQSRNFDTEVPPAGAIPARICALIDVGTHDSRNQRDGSVFDRRVLIIGYELGEQNKQGRPFYMAKHYTLSLATGQKNSNLYNLVRALNGTIPIGSKFQTGWLDAKGCILQISHSEKVKTFGVRTYANIDSVIAPPRGTITPQGSCEIWRINDRLTDPLPDLGYLPSLWHDAAGLMLTVAEWVDESKEVNSHTAEAANPLETRASAPRYADHLPPVSSNQAAKTQEEDDADGIPF